MGGIVEGFVEGSDKRSPSAQLRLEPSGRPLAVSTHDQVLGGPTGQVFLGGTFPAHQDYRLEIQEAGLRVAEVLAKRGAVGRIGVDYVSVRDEQGGWRHYAIEINLRKGGTTHPFMMLQFLTDGCYDPDSGSFRTRTGPARCYYATDNLESPRYRGLTPDDLIDIAVCHDLHFHGTSVLGHGLLGGRGRGRGVDRRRGRHLHSECQAHQREGYGVPAARWRAGRA